MKEDFKQAIFILAIQTSLSIVSYYFTSNLQMPVILVFIYLTQTLGFCISGGLRKKNQLTTEYFDAIGGATNIGSVMISLFFLENHYFVFSLTTVCILLWAFRLSFFLFYRILIFGSDKRLDFYKGNISAFITLWQGQSAWIYFTLFSYLFTTGLYSKSSAEPPSFGLINFLGFLLWIAGFVFEIIADIQKFKFKKLGNKLFIKEGLWSISRHPNYFGEITLWIGISLMCFQRGLKWFTPVLLISPGFVIYLLYFVSGIPMAEQLYEKKYGNKLEYIEYREKTPLLVPYKGICNGYGAK